MFQITINKRFTEFGLEMFLERNNLLLISELIVSMYTGQRA